MTKIFDPDDADPAEVVRHALSPYASSKTIEALDALIQERDDLRAWRDALPDEYR